MLGKYCWWKMTLSYERVLLICLRILEKVRKTGNQWKVVGKEKLKEKNRKAKKTEDGNLSFFVMTNMICVFNLFFR